MMIHLVHCDRPRGEAWAFGPIDEDNIVWQDVEPTDGRSYSTRDEAEAAAREWREIFDNPRQYEFRKRMRGMIEECREILDQRAGK